MVSFRCKQKVREELEGMGIMIPEINHGSVEFQEELTAQQVLQLKDGISELGFEVLDEVNSKLLDRISESISALICTNAKIPKKNYAEYLSERIGFDTSEVTKLFLQVHGMSLSRYIEVQQIERAKEVLLLYEDLSLEEAAAMCQFEDSLTFSRTFEENTGLEPLYYKKIKKKRLEVKQENRFESNEIRSRSVNECAEPSVFAQFRADSRH